MTTFAFINNEYCENWLYYLFMYCNTKELLLFCHFGQKNLSEIILDQDDKYEGGTFD